MKNSVMSLKKLTLWMEKEMDLNIVIVSKSVSQSFNLQSFPFYHLIPKKVKVSLVFGTYTYNKLSQQ